MDNYQEAKLKSLGESASNFTDATPIESATSFLERVQANIRSEGTIDTGNILNLSIETDGNTINILGPKYIYYIDLGIKGQVSSALAPDSPYRMTKLPPPRVFAEWIERKNLRMRNTKAKSITQQVEQASWAMAKHRLKYGAEAHNIFTKEIPQLVQDSLNEVGDIVINQFLGNI